MEPAHKFRLYVGERRCGLHVLVNVWRTHAEMHRWQRATVKRKYRSDKAVMFTARVDKEFLSGRRDPMFAEVNLNLSYTNVGAVSHEMVHATAQYFRRIGVEFSEESEELFAHVQGWLLLQFVHRAQRARIYV